MSEQKNVVPRIVGIWRDNIFHVNDLSRVTRYDEVRLMDVRECEAIFLKERAAREEAEGKLAKALEFYANEDSWQDVYHDAGDEPGDIAMSIDPDDVEYRFDSDGEISWSCGGKTARDALATLRGEKP